MRQIVVPKWDGPDGFQHYKNREPIWIKTYTRLHSDDKYLSLTGHRRAVLHGIWIEYARSGRQLTDDTRTLTYRLHLKVTMADLKALETLGFIEMPLADGKHDASPEERRQDKRQQDQPLLTTDPVDVDDPWPVVVDGWTGKPSSTGAGGSFDTIELLAARVSGRVVDLASRRAVDVFVESEAEEA